MNHYLVAYDICCPKRRRKLLKVLEDFAYRVQYSVFEMYVGEIELKKRSRKRLDLHDFFQRNCEQFLTLLALTEKNRMIYGLKYKETAAYNDKYRIL